MRTPSKEEIGADEQVAVRAGRGEERPCKHRAASVSHVRGVGAGETRGHPPEGYSVATITDGVGTANRRRAGHAGSARRISSSGGATRRRARSAGQRTEGRAVAERHSAKQRVLRQGAAGDAKRGGSKARMPAGERRQTECSPRRASRARRPRACTVEGNDWQMSRWPFERKEERSALQAGRTCH